MNLYALKSKDGYLKKIKNNKCLIVPLEKASVFPDISSQEMQDLKELAYSCGLVHVSIVMLTIIEKTIKDC
jgi:hypothetical protein